jgi:hypothetical protein
MAMQVFAIALIIHQIMRGGKAAVNSKVIH